MITKMFNIRLLLFGAVLWGGGGVMVAQTNFTLVCHDERVAEDSTLMAYGDAVEAFDLIYGVVDSDERSLTKDEDLLLSMKNVDAMLQGGLAEFLTPQRTLTADEKQRFDELSGTLLAVTQLEQRLNDIVTRLRTKLAADRTRQEIASRNKTTKLALWNAARKALDACESGPPVTSRPSPPPVVRPVNPPPVVTRVNRGRLLLIKQTNNLASVANGDPLWRNKFAGFDPESTSNTVTVTPLPESNDIPAYGRFRVGWAGVPDIMEDGKDYPITLSASTLNIPRGATGSNVTLRLNTDMLGTATITDKNGVTKPFPFGSVDLFVGNGGGGMVLNDSVTVTLHPTKIDATPTSNAEYSFDVFVGGGPGITYHYQISR